MSRESRTFDVGGSIEDSTFDDIHSTADQLARVRDSIRHAQFSGVHHLPPAEDGRGRGFWIAVITAAAAVVGAAAAVLALIL